MDYNNSAPYEHPPGRFIEVPGGRLWVETEGDGEPLLLIAGGPGAAHTYMHMCRPLAAHRKLIYFDARGCGQTGPFRGKEELRLGASVADLEHLRQALGFERWDVLGHSYGVFVAMAYALAHPKHVSRLVLANGYASGLDWQEACNHANVQASHQYPELWEEVLKLRRDGFSSASPEMQRAFALDPSFVYFRNPSNSSKTVFEINPRVVVALYGDDVDFCLDATIHDLNFEKRLVALPSATLVIAGRWDRLVTPKLARRFITLVPHAQFVMMENSGHLPFLEEPEATFTLLTKFLCVPLST